MEKKYPIADSKAKFEYVTQPHAEDVESTEIFSVENNRMSVWMRKPDGLQYKNKKPVVIFGCSYAYGFALNDNQTFSYKLANILKRPVYNRAVTGNGLQLMYLQSLKKPLYRDVPKPDTVIYLMLNDHYRRMLGETFDIRDRYFYPYFAYKNGELIYDEHKNPIINFFQSSYFVKFILRNKIRYQLQDYKQENYLTDFALAYFIKTKEQIETKYNTKIKFYVVLYDVYLHSDMLKQKLLKNGFSVIDVQDLTKEDLYSSKYYSKETIHPRESVWTLLTPLIAERIK